MAKISSKDEDLLQEIPEIIYDCGNRTSYKRGRFFGKGGFAKCYEITEIANGSVYAGKIVSKKMMAKNNQREKMSQEIAIHRELQHKNVVGFKGFFEDSFNIYIILELCRKRSMMELHKRRKALTEPETRFYMKQILTGVQYLHDHRIIHRDLKLGNLFLNDELHVKIGDFGLATKIEFDGERKKTLCGTPNYIAPEILNKKGHSFEVDVWSIGCIMYTLLIGKPPFETGSLKETYSRIKKCEYRVPQTITKVAANMIMKMLQSEPKIRPKVDQLLKHDFFFSGYLPSSLPISCLTMAPRFDQMYDRQNTNGRTPLLEVNNVNTEGPMLVESSPYKKKTGHQDSIAASGGLPTSAPNAFDARNSLLSLREQLAQLFKSKPAGCENDKMLSDEMTDPAAQPLVWVSKWVDYSDKYGFGYQLADDSVGVMFNDTTKLIMLANGHNVHYISREGNECYMTVNQYPKSLEKKMKLLSYFHRYMLEHLMKAGATVLRENDQLSRVPHLYQWCRTTSSVIMQLTNGTIQLNFLDHTKIIMCPLMSAVTYIDSDKSFRTFRFSTLQEQGCDKGLFKNLRYAYDKIGVLLDK